MTCVSCITFEINALENTHSNHVSILKTRKSKIRDRTNIATKRSTIPRKMKRVSYYEKYVRIKGASHELLERIEEVSRKPKNVRNQSSNTFDKVTCFDKTSMINFDDERARSF